MGVIRTLGPTGTLPNVMTTPNVPASLPTLLGITGAALLVGFGTGRMSAPAPVPPSAPSVTIGSGEVRTLHPLHEQPLALGAGSTVEKTFSQADWNKALQGKNALSRSKALQELLSKEGLPGVKQALAWANALPEGPAKRAVMDQVIQRWAELDGASAAEYGVGNFQQTGNTAQLRAALLGWAQGDPSASMQYLQGLGLGNGLMRILSRDLLGVWSNVNPQQAATYLQSNPSLLEGSRFMGWGGSHGGGAASVVAANWAAQDPAAAMQWVSSSLSGNQRFMAANRVIQSWAAQDLSGATAYVSSLPPGQDHEMFVNLMAQEIAMDNPASAMQWAASLTNQGMQIGSAMSVLGHAGVMTSSGTDLQAAQSLLRNSGLNPNVQSNILTILTQQTQRKR